MKQNFTQTKYVSPQLEMLGHVAPSVLCQSDSVEPGANEGIGYEEWN